MQTPNRNLHLLGAQAGITTKASHSQSVLHRKTADASMLMMLMMRFISPSDPRWLSILSVIQEHLTEDNLVYR